MNDIDDITDPIPADDLATIPYAVARPHPARTMPPGITGRRVRIRRYDLKRFLAQARFLDVAISDMDSAIAAGGDRAAAQWVNS